MSVDSAITYTSVHSEARSWSIPSEDPYEEAARQLLEQAPHSPEYVPDPMELEDHVPVYIPEPEHPEDLVPAEDEAPTSLLPPSFLAPRIRPLSPRALEVEMRDIASAFYHSLHPSETPPLLPIPAPSTSRRADIPEADTPPRKRLLLTTPRPGREIGESSAALCLRDSSDTIETRTPRYWRRIMTALELCNRRLVTAVRAEIEVLRRERLAYEQESIQTRQDLARTRVSWGLNALPESATYQDFMIGTSTSCVRDVPEESDKIERYVGRLPDMIHGNIVASKPKTMQEAIEMALK
ncbi:hypothetical protein Tco_0110418 [Tanacetum coccineum]